MKGVRNMDSLEIWMDSKLLINWLFMDGFGVESGEVVSG